MAHNGDRGVEEVEGNVQIQYEAKYATNFKFPQVLKSLPVFGGRTLLNYLTDQRHKCFPFNIFPQEKSQVIVTLAQHLTGAVET